MGWQCYKSTNIISLFTSVFSAISTRSQTVRRTLDRGVLNIYLGCTLWSVHVSPSRWRKRYFLRSLLLGFRLVLLWCNVQPVISYFKADFLFLKPGINKCSGTTKSRQLGPHCSMQISHSVDRELWRAGLWPKVLVWLPGLLKLSRWFWEKLATVGAYS